jgi:SNF2 family DNA or RNA helicase
MELYQYQKLTANKALKYFEDTTIEYPKFNIFFKMGLGKTVTALEIVKQVKPKTVLIVCPKSLIEMWIYEFYKYLGNTYSRLKNIDTLNVVSLNSVFFVNYEQLLSLRTEIIPDICIFDEVHKIKNINGKIHKNINKYILPRKTICLTGTPIVKDLMDLFGILTCVGPQKFDNLVASQFRYKYIINGGRNRTSQLWQSIEPFTVQLEYDGLLDMPKTEDIVIPIDLDNVSKQELSVIYHKNTNALARITEAVLLTSMNIQKRATCCQLINDIIADNEKVVLFVRFTEEYEYFINLYQSNCVGINGEVNDRDWQVQEFETNPNVKLFVGNLQTAGVGITLIKAHKCIFYSETYSWGDAEQSRARIFRIGQDKPCIYYHLLCRDSIDELIYQNILNKTSLIEEFKRLYGGL